MSFTTFLKFQDHYSSSPFQHLLNLTYTILVLLSCGLYYTLCFSFSSIRQGRSKSCLRWKMGKYGFFNFSCFLFFSSLLPLFPHFPELCKAGSRYIFSIFQLWNTVHSDSKQWDISYPEISKAWIYCFPVFLFFLIFWWVSIIWIFAAVLGNFRCR